MSMKVPVRFGSIHELVAVRRSRSRWFRVALAALGVVAGLALFDRVVMPLVVHPSADRRVPDLRNRTFADAEVRLRAARLELGRSLEVTDEVRPTGTIVAQEPPAGARVRSGRKVNLLVSSGPAVRQIPDLTGKTARLASIELSQVGLSAGVTMIVPSTLLREGEIIGTRPARGERPERGGKIDLLVSGGSPRGLYLMPDLRGVPFDEASRRLRAAGIFVSGERLGDRVLTQDPPPGSPIAWGDAARID
jgi:serine/threonine-protein kinase